LTGGVYLDGAAHNRCSIDAGDKCLCLSSCPADSDRIGFGANTCVADIDVVIARGEIDAGVKAYCDVVIAVVVKESVVAAGGVVGSGCVDIKHPVPDGRVERS
jgi:hypothetical protein